MFYLNLDEHQSACALGCSRSLAFDFLFIFKWKSARCCFGPPQTRWFWFSITIDWKSIRFFSRVPLTNFLWFSIQFDCASTRFCSGLAQTNSLWFSFKVYIQINQILFWAGPGQCPLVFYYNFNEHQSDSALWCPRPIAIDFLWNSNENQFEFALGWPRPITCFFWLIINQILLWGAPDKVLLICNWDVIENLPDCSGLPQTNLL